MKSDKVEIAILVVVVVVVVLLLLLLLLLHSQLHLWDSPFGCEIFTHVTVVGFFFCFCFFLSSHSHIIVTYVFRGWCTLGVFVAHIHPSRTYMKVRGGGGGGGQWSVPWNACVHRLDLGFYFHPKEFLGIGIRTHLKSKGKISSIPT